MQLTDIQIAEVAKWMKSKGRDVLARHFIEDFTAMGSISTKEANQPINKQSFINKLKEWKLKLKP